MEDGEVEISDRATSGDSILEELLKNNTASCTHTHTCNLPAPDHASHSHTCFHTHTHTHTHTHLIPEQGDNCHSKGSDNNGSSSSLRPKKRSSGNREAVRKYREKKKAQTAYLEDEVKRLRALNHHLLRKLQSQATLEAEVMRLRGLLVDLRGKIDSELGVLSFQRQCSGVGFAFKEGVCKPATVDCRGNTAGFGGGEGQTLDTVDSFVSSGSQAG